VAAQIRAHNFLKAIFLFATRKRRLRTKLLHQTIAPYCLPKLFYNMIPTTMIPTSNSSEPSFRATTTMADSTTRSIIGAKKSTKNDRRATVTENETAYEILAPVPAEFFCPLSFTVMDDPLMTRSGLSFERSAVLDWLDKKNECVCPITGGPLLPSMLVPNVPLRIRIRQWINAPELAKGLHEGGQEKQADQQPGHKMMEEEILSSDDDSWCWDADIDLCSITTEDIAEGGGKPRLHSPPPKHIVVFGENTKTGMVMASSKIEISEVPPQQAMRTATRKVLKAARSA
jgi:hypothetical protein